ncbi:HNH endonuclease signature motif containing protein [Macrococcus bovicus]|uniref:HNH endonuclease n=1 Tax=Macrococcus bovicus TaxID=69968 RepID=A0A4V3BF50_9STAP|nr:HNH endonuclease signature motif containing protein [Macrococcus bovicus]TDM12680.1 HNH endonuclease [Macrococcus bovicus]
MNNQKFIFTEEMDLFLRKNNEGISNKILHQMFREHFNCNIGLSTFKNRRKSLGLHSGLTGRYEKGHTSWNKGKSMPSHPNSVKTQFKKGQRPTSFKEIGSERIVEGYYEVKVANPSTWKAKHRLIWEEHHGPIPDGHVVMFADQNPMNCTIDNLMLVSRGQMAILNQNNLLQDSKELNETALLVADVISATYQRKKSLKKKRGKKNVKTN